MCAGCCAAFSFIDDWAKAAPTRAFLQAQFGITRTSCRAQFYNHWGNPWIVYAYNDRSGNFDGIRMAYLSRASAAAIDDSMGTNVNFTRANACRVTGEDITGWEAVQMAAPFRVAYDRLNIAAWPPARYNVLGTTAPAAMADANRPAGGGTQGRAWGAAIGYASGGDNRFRIGYFFWPNVAFGG